LIPVEFRYRPIAWLPFGKTIKASHPSSWGELDLFQFADVVEFLNSPYTKENHDKLINSLLDLKEPLAGFPDEIKKLHEFIKTDYPLTTWVVKHLVAGGQIMLGPFDRFRNVTIGEFIFGDSFFLSYIDRNEPDLLNRFLAVYYRPVIENPDPDSTVDDDRIKFNPKHIDERYELFSSVDDRVKAAVVFNYKNVRSWIQDKYSWLFPKSSGSGSEKKENKSPWRDFAGIIIGGDYVNQEKIMQTLMHTVMYDMNKKIRENAKMKKR